MESWFYNFHSVQIGMRTNYDQKIIFYDNLTDEEINIVTNFILSFEQLLHCSFLKQGDLVPSKVEWCATSSFNIKSKTDINHEDEFAYLHL